MQPHPAPKYSRLVIAMENFEITDNGLPEVDKNTFYCNVSNKMKKHMKVAYIRLLGKDNKFMFGKSPVTIVSGKPSHNPDKDYKKYLCLRIDLQGTFENNIAGRRIKFANIQIQLNKEKNENLSEKDPTTLAQVHFQYEVDIPEDVIKSAFERSWTERKIIYVYTK